MPVTTISTTRSGAASSARPAESTASSRPCLSRSEMATHRIRAVTPATANEDRHSRRHHVVRFSSCRPAAASRKRSPAVPTSTCEADNTAPRALATTSVLLAERTRSTTGSKYRYGYGRACDRDPARPPRGCCRAATPSAAGIHPGLFLPRPQGYIRHRPEVAKLVGVDDGPKRLHHAAGDLELDHGDHAPLGVVQHGAGLAVDPGQPQRGVQEPATAENAGDQPHDALP